MTYVIGVDTGGTFTDAFLASEHGRVASAKTSSTPPDFARGFLAAIGDLADSLGVPVAAMLADTDYIVHGTTSTLNAIVTGDVAPVGFLTTRGHADSIAIMNLEGRYAGLGADRVQHMARTNKPAPLIPRHRIVEIDERIDYKGDVVVGLDEEGVRAAVARLLADGVEAIAVSLLWSFRNPLHERRIRELIHEQAPGLYVALSSEVSPRIREYARSATTILNTQVGPRLRSYLAPLEAQLRELGFAGSLLVMQGSGGCVAAADAPAHAITTIGSVLTGGVVGCTHLATALGHNHIISTDMGGTTFLAGLILDGEPVMSVSTVLNQYTISTPMVEVHTIGAGGGAIAGVDPGGNLRVGPRSAGARPGPACYDEGGTEPTVTDVDVVLGIVNPDHFLGGRKKLSRDRAAEAIRREIAEPLGLSVEDAAAAVYAIQNAQTADLVRKVVVNSGQDPRDFILYSFGGAGPVHAASYAADLGVEEVLVPLGATAAVFSAYGLAASDIVLTAEISQPSNFPLDPKVIQLAFDELEKELRNRLAAHDWSSPQSRSGVSSICATRCRWPKSLHPFLTATSPKPSSPASAGSSRRRYEQLYGKGSGFADAGLQAITYRLRAVGQLPIRPELPTPPAWQRHAGLSSGSRRFSWISSTAGSQRRSTITRTSRRGTSCPDPPSSRRRPRPWRFRPAGCGARVDRLGNLVIRFSES